MNKPASVYVTYIASTPDAVWRALTDGEFTRRYWGGYRIQSDWAVGSPVKLLGVNGEAGWEGEVLVADPPRRLSYSFHMLISAAHSAERPSRVSFEIEPLGSLVRLTLVHHEFVSPGATFETSRYGWPAIVSSLKSLLETGSPLPFVRLGFGPSPLQRELMPDP
jgi:uncharacterized protein YndB with AHSA1/START domain